MAIVLNRIDVIVHEEPAEWWQIAAAFTPLAAFLVVAAALVWYAFRRPASRGGVAAAGLRVGSWDHAEWALDMALDDNSDRRRVGLAVLDQLSTSHLMCKEDAQIVMQAKALLDKV